MPRWSVVFLAILVLLCPNAHPAFAGKRVALVVGNSAYQHVSGLPNPTRDAFDMASTLRGIGFEVKQLQDADKDSFEEALSEFSDVATGAEFAIVYFAGHGVEVDHQNYLIPVDAVLATDRRLRFEALSLDDVLGALEGVTGIRIVLLDACRNNPFAASMKMTSATRSIGRGLSRVDAPNGTVISYSAKEGTVASDGDGRNSPFTAALLANIAKPGLEIQFLLREVRDRVLTATNGEQEPFISSSLPREAVYLVPPAVDDTSSSVTGPRPDQAAADYQLAERVGTAEAWDAFLTKYGETKGNFYASLAKAARQKLAINSPPLEPAAVETQKEQKAQIVAARTPDTDAEISLTKSERLRIELALMQQDLEPGEIDGEFDGETRGAIKAWQYASGFKTAGTLDQSQIDKLMGIAGDKKIDTSKIAAAYNAPPPGADERLIRAVDALKGLSFTHAIAGGHLYIAVVETGGVSFQEARDLAERAGGSLACISSSNENTAVFDLIKEDHRFWWTDTADNFISGPWIGLYQEPDSRTSKRGWTWVDGCKSNYRNWKSGQPNEVDHKSGPGGAAYGANGTKVTPLWQDAILSKPRAPGFIIEIE